MTTSHEIFSRDKIGPFDAATVETIQRLTGKISDPQALCDKLRAMGYDIDHHESDLYVRQERGVEDVLMRWEWAGTITEFLSAIDGEPHYEVPFAYRERLPDGREAVGTYS